MKGIVFQSAEGPGKAVVLEEPVMILPRAGEVQRLVRRDLQRGGEPRVVRLEPYSEAIC